MKNILTTLVLVLIFAFGLALAQNITNTLGTGGLFTIKDGSTNYFTLSQLTGNVSLFRNMELGGITNSTSTRGVITKNGFRFMHNYQAPGTDGFNTFIGLEAGNFTMSGSFSYEASYNTGVGYISLFSLTTGYYNSAFGSYSLSYNTTGSGNSTLGYLSLYANTTGYLNSAFGYASLFSNTTGFSNSAFGSQSLYNTTGNQNTAIGNFAGSNITTGSNNIAIGYDAHVPSSAASNQIRLGNTSITYAGIQVAWTVTSDRRYKENITPIGLGLGFISKLNPVSYTRINDENHRTEYGLIAQEVEQVLKELGIENHAMLTITDEGMYELRYNDLLAPMIKAIQELAIKNEQLKIQNEKLASALDGLEIKNTNLEERLAKYEEMQALLVKELEQIKSNQQNITVQLVNSEDNNQ